MLRVTAPSGGVLYVNNEADGGVICHRRTAYLISNYSVYMYELKECSKGKGLKRNKVYIRRS